MVSQYRRSAATDGSTADNPHLAEMVVSSGPAPEDAVATAVVVHGRHLGGPPYMEEHVLRRLGRDDLAYVLPTAADDCWYPLSFLAAHEDNEPRLTQALDCLSFLADDVASTGVPAEKVVWVGFSQGGCLVSEWVARHPRRYGGIVVFTGGLIGPPGSPLEHSGDLAGTPVFLGTSDADPFVPLDRVQETARIFEAMGAAVELRVYPGLGHEICDDEIEACRSLLEGFR